MDTHNKSDKKILLFITLPLLVFLIIAFFSRTAMDILQGVVDIADPGRSYAKVYLSISYLIVLTIIAIIARKKISNEVHLKKEVLLLWVGIFIIFALNVASYLWFVFTYHLSLITYFVAYSHDTMSSTQFTHSHVLKGTIATIGQYVHTGAFHNLDAGFAFLGMLPTWFYILPIPFFLGVLLLFFSIFYKKVYAYNEQKLRQKIFYILAFGVSSFIILRTFFDGGFFDYAVLPAMTSLWFLIYPNFSRKNIKLWSVFPSVYLLIIIVFFIPNAAQRWFQEIEYFFNMLVITGVLGMLVYYSRVKKPRRIGVIILVLVFIAFVYSATTNLDILNYRSQVVPESGAIVASYPTLGGLYQPIDTLGSLHYYLYKPISGQKISVGSLADSIDVLDNYNPVLIPGISCVPANGLNPIAFHLTTNKPVVLAPESSVSVSKMQFIDSFNGLYLYHVIVNINPCFPEPFDLLKEYFMTQGLDSFVISNINGSI